MLARVLFLFMGMAFCLELPAQWDPYALGAAPVWPPEVQWNGPGNNGATNLGQLFGSWVYNDGLPPFEQSSIDVQINPNYWTLVTYTWNVDKLEAQESHCSVTWGEVAGEARGSVGVVAAARASNYCGSGKIVVHDKGIGDTVETYEALPDQGASTTPPRLARLARGKSYGQTAAGAFGEDGIARCACRLQTISNIFPQTYTVEMASKKDNDSGGSSFSFPLFGLSITVPSWTGSNGYETDYDSTRMFGSKMVKSFFVQTRGMADIRVSANDDLFWPTTPKVDAAGWAATHAIFKLQK